MTSIRIKLALLTAGFFVLNLATGIAQEQSMLIPYNQNAASPKAQLSDVSWIAGNWQGEAMGGMIEEVWTPPLGESMMGMFKLVLDGKVKFYEFMTISEENQSLVLKIKHFGADLIGWEEKEESEIFKLVKLEGNSAYFDNFTFEKVGENQLNMYVLFEENGEVAQFKYKRR